MNTGLVNRVDAVLASSTARSCRPETATYAALDGLAVLHLSVERASLLRPVLAMPAIGIRRRTLHSSGLGCVEDFSAPGDYPAPCGHSTEYQLVLPYTGAFEWHVGAKTVFMDGTRVLFVSAGEDYAESHVAGCGHDSIIITPRLSVLQELCGHAVPSRHPAFQRVAESTTPRMNLRNHRLLRLEASGNDPLAGDEVVIALLNEALGPRQRVARTSPLRVVDAAKQFLHAHLCEPISLDEIAHAVQVSGAYLTDAFTRSEGVPLCRYRVRLRLNRALVDLPRCGDITGLALELGFSSHAHFSTAFKSLFGASPSAFRAGCGKPRRAVRVAPACAKVRAPA
jgi:AraC family transcriptional regulator